MRNKLLVAAGVTVVAYGALMYSKGDSIRAGFAGGKFVVADSRHRFDYSVDAESSVAGLLIATSPQRGITQGGSVAGIHYFDEAAAAEYLRTQQPGRLTPSFYNAHAKHRLLVPATPAVEARLKALVAENSEDTAGRRRFTLRGYCIRAVERITVDGKRGVPVPHLFDNCNVMVATDINVQPVALPKVAEKR